MTLLTQLMIEAARQSLIRMATLWQGERKCLCSTTWVGWVGGGGVLTQYACSLYRTMAYCAMYVCTAVDEALVSSCKWGHCKGVDCSQIHNSRGTGVSLAGPAIAIPKLALEK